MIALSGIHELKVTVRENWPLTIVPQVPPDRPLATNQFKTNKNSAPALFVVPPFNVTEMRHFKNHQSLSMMAIMVKAQNCSYKSMQQKWINGGHSDEKPGIFQYQNEYEKRRNSNNYVIRLGNSYQKK